MHETTEPNGGQRPVNRLDLLFSIRAYNRKEISLEECLRRSVAWAQAVIDQYGPPDAPRRPQPEVRPD
jgi:hypothetical protein